SITNASPGRYSLKILVPNCWFQVDFVCGLPIDTHGPAGSNIFYSPQGRLFESANGGTRAYAPSTLAALVFIDNNNTCAKDWKDKGIAGVRLNLNGTDIHGNPVFATTTTDSSGSYVFTGLPASSPAGYSISEIQPAGYLDGKESVGSLGGAVANDVLTTR